MADVGPFYYPLNPWVTVGSFTYTTRTLSNNTSNLAHVMEVNRDDTITHVGIRQSSITIPTGPCVLRVGLQSLNSSGIESGTWLASGAGYADYSGWSSANDGTYIWIALDTPVDVVQGQQVAIVLDPQSGFDASNFVILSTNVASTVFSARNPYLTTGGAKSTTPQITTIALRSSQYCYGPVVKAAASYTFNSTSTPDETALRIMLDSDVCDTYDIDAIGFSCSANTTGRSYRVRVYDTDGSTVLYSKDFDTSKMVNQPGLFFSLFDDTITLQSGSEYRVSITSLSTAPMTPLYVDLSDENDRTGIAFGGTIGGSVRTDLGAWTDSDTRIPMMFVRIVGMSGGGGGGGGLLVHPGMAGGMRG